MGPLPEQAQRACLGSLVLLPNRAHSLKNSALISHSEVSSVRPKRSSWHVSQYNPSLESVDVVSASSQLGLELLWIQILFCWSDGLANSHLRSDHSNVDDKVPTLTSSAAHQDEQPPQNSGSKRRSDGSVPQTEGFSCKPIKYPTWPMTRYEASGLQDSCPVDRVNPPGLMRGVFDSAAAVGQHKVINMLAHYRLCLVLLSTTRTCSSDGHFVQCPTSGHGPTSFPKQNENIPESRSTDKSLKRLRPDANALDGSLSKRLDVGIKDRGAAPSDDGFPCPYYGISHERHQNCWKKKWRADDLRKLKEHLYDEHERIVCNACQLAFRDRADFHQHTHRVNGVRDFVEGFDHFQKEDLKCKRIFRGKAGQEYYHEIWRILFPHDPDRLPSSTERLLSQAELEDILQRRAREEQDRYRRLYYDLISEVRSSGPVPAMVLSGINTVFNRNSPCATPFTCQERSWDHVSLDTTGAFPNDIGDTSSTTTAIRTWPAVDPAVGTLRSPNHESLEPQNDVSMDHAQVEEWDDMYGGGSDTSPYLPRTPLQSLPRRMSTGVTAWGQPFLDIPDHGEQWRHREHDIPSSPSGLETVSSSSPRSGLQGSSGTQEAGNRDHTPVSSVHEEDDLDPLFGELLRVEVLRGIDEGETQAPPTTGKGQDDVDTGQTRSSEDIRGNKHID